MLNQFTIDPLGVLQSGRALRGKQDCPSCGKHTFSVKSDGSIGKCFHPSCGWFITRHGEGQSESHFIHGVLHQFYDDCHTALLAQERSGKSNGWTYLVDERSIHPQVVCDSLLGAVPSDYPVSNLFTKLYSTSDQSSPGDFQKKLETINEAKDKLERCLSGASGWLCFFYTDVYHQIAGVRFRLPYSKEIRYFKPLPYAGLFGRELYSEDEGGRGHHLSNDLIVCEGEFNQLQLQSLTLRYREATGKQIGYVDACAVGGVNNADVASLPRVCQTPIICYDNDTTGAGYRLVERATEYSRVKAFTTPAADSDLDEFIRSFGDRAVDAYEAVKGLITSSITYARSYSHVCEEMNRIRQNRKLRDFEINQSVAEDVYADLGRRGRFFHNPQGAYFFNDEEKRLIEISGGSTDCKLLLHKYGLNSSESIFKYVTNDLWARARSEGLLTAVHRLSCYEPERDILHIFNQGNQTYRITSSTIETVDNGTDGILFLPSEGSHPFVLGPRRADSLLDQLILSPINFSRDVLTADERRMILLHWLFCLFFREIMPTKPILAFVGEKGSGKTLTLRKIGLMLFGDGFNVMPLPDKEDGFDAAVTNSAFVAIDNADTRCQWLEDRLAEAASGGKIRKRALYTDNQMIEIPITSFIAITSRTPHFRRDDVADRLLIMRVDRLDQFRPENEILDEILVNRDRLMSEVIYSAQEVVRALASKYSPPTSSFRMADFASFCLKVAMYGGLEGKLRTVLGKLGSEQSVFALENEPIYTLLRDWAAEHPNHPTTTAVLYHELRSRAESTRSDLGCKNERAFGQRLASLKSNLEQFLDVEVEIGRGRTRIWKFRLKQETEGKW